MFRRSEPSTFIRSPTQALIAELRQQILEQIVKSLVERIDDAADEAVTRLIELIQAAKSETVQFKAIESVLGRSSKAPKRQIHQTHEVRAKVAHVLFPDRSLRLRTRQHSKPR